jgi:hypothetical protein
MAVLKRMAEFLSQAQRFSVTVDTGFDVVQDSGQKIEFGETRQIVLRRPDRVRIEATKRNGSNPTLTPARYMQGLTIDKIIACEIFASRVCM